METISSQVARRRWAWLRHVLRMDHNSHPRTALTGCRKAKERGVDRERHGAELWKGSLRILTLLRLVSNHSSDDSFAIIYCYFVNYLFSSQFDSNVGHEYYLAIFLISWKQKSA